jgi:hypothetical protein
MFVSTSVLANTRMKAAIPSNTPDKLNQQEILELLRSAIKDRPNKQARHPELRENYLLNLAEALVLKQNPSLSDPTKTLKLEKKKSKQIKAMAKREKKKRMYAKIGDMLSPPHDNMRGLCRIDVPASFPLEPYPIGPDPKTWEGPWCSITDPDLIAKFHSNSSPSNFST